MNDDEYYPRMTPERLARLAAKRRLRPPPARIKWDPDTDPVAPQEQGEQKRPERTIVVPSPSSSHPQNQP